MTENQTEFSGWARVEVMGHNTHIGFTTTQVFGQAVMFRVDQPGIPECEETLVRNEWVGDTYAHAGSVVKRGEIPPVTVFIGSGSIYRMIPCDEAAAMAAIRASVRPPVSIVKLADRKELPAAMINGDEYEGVDEGVDVGF